ncbi:MAG: Brp/Blh family beta-carotene 15,15'-dioxygenase [Planctomycetes bacterium]|nr:Brp/Blh family beta-carotene 15,15'-dioxygenase [Planctomycetota bacterium]
MHAASITLLAWAMIGAACLFPAATAVSVGSVLALLVAVVGLPHGAADHRFARSRLEPLLGPAWWGVFLAGYLAIAGAVVLGWFLAPAATILVFFLASAWHFGQEEPDLAPGPRGAKLLRQAFRVARGGLVIWVPVALQTDEVVRILSLTAPRGCAPEIEWAVDTLVACSWVMLAVAGVAWGWQALLAIGSEGRRRRVLLLDTLMVASLVLLFAWVNPVVGFLVSFCGWHSARGLRRLRRELGESWWQLAVSLAPMTALAIGLIGCATCLMLRAPTWNDTLIRATFLGLSAVALPHLLLHGAGPVIDQLSRHRAAQAVELRGAA